MKKTLNFKRDRDYCSSSCSCSSVKKAKKNSSPVLNESHDYDYSHEESSGNILATMSEEFLDLYDDLDDWGQEDCEPVLNENHDCDDNHEESSGNILATMSAEFLDLYDDLDDWGQEDCEPEEKTINVKEDLGSNIKHDQEESSGDTVETVFLEDCEPEDEINSDDSSYYGKRVVDDKFVIDIDLYDDLDDWRDDYWEEEQRVKAELASKPTSELCGNDGGRCEGGETEDKVLCDDNDPCEEEKIEISYDSFDVAIAQMKERLKKKKAMLQSGQYDDLLFSKKHH